MQFSPCISFPILYNHRSHGHEVERSVIDLDEVRVRPVERSEEVRHRELMASHHYLGYLPKIGHTRGTWPPIKISG